MMWWKTHVQRRRRRTARYSWLCSIGVILLAAVVLFLLIKLLAPALKVTEYSLLAFYGGRRSTFNFKLPAQVWGNLNPSAVDDQPRTLIGNPSKSASDGLRDLLNYVNNDMDSDSSNGEVYVNHVPNYRVVHLDFKGARPKLNYLKAVLPMVNKAGANALLVEYEDSFPFAGNLANLSAANSFTEDELADFISFSAELGLEIIPLVQTFGHLEYALKLDEFSHLREVFAEPQDVCPSKVDAFELIKDIIDQVMAFHPDSKFLHIGCDEVFNLARCEKCLAKIETSRKTNLSQQRSPLALVSTPNEEQKLYLEHVVKVASFVKSQYDVQPLIWDDMLRKIPAKTLLASKISDVVEPVIWVYSKDFDREFPSRLWSVYSRVFPRIWGASAFKGASSPTEYAPNVYQRVVNNLAWQRVITSEDKFFKAISGLVFTGWSRFDHFATLCELLPNSIPSLLLNLLLISRGSTLTEVASVFHEILSCPDLFVTPLSLRELEGSPRLWEVRRCGFPGADVVELAWNYQGVKLQTDAFIRSITSDSGQAAAWLSDYNLEHNSTSRRRTAEGLAFLPQVTAKVSKLEQEANKTLSRYFDEFVVKEWLEQRIEPLVRGLQDVERRGSRAIRVSKWRRRPFG